MNSYSNQQNAYRKASVNTLDQNKLIVMLYDGAIKQSGFAVEYIKKNDIFMVIDKKNILGGNVKFDITKIIIEKLDKELPSLNLK